MQVLFDFELPKGYVDADGQVHKKGKMRLATAQDEVEAERDMRVRGNPSYLPVVLFSRVVTELEGVRKVDENTILGMFTTDLAYLQEVYQRINGLEPQPNMTVECSRCGAKQQVEVRMLDKEKQ